MALSTNFRPSCLQSVRGIDLEVTSACSADCTFCPRSEIPDTKTFISMDIVNRLADDLRQYGDQQEVTLCGIGESTLHPKLGEIVETLSQAGARVSMTTHGAHMTVKKFEKLVGQGLVELHFSINAATAETHRKIMRLKVFDRIVGNLQEILELRSSLCPELPLLVSFVVCESNEHEVNDFVQFWRDTSVTKIWLHPANNRAGLVSPEAKSVSMSKIRERYGDDQRVIVDVFGHYEQHEDLCKIAHSMIFISADGNMRLCALDYRRMTNYGSLASQALHEMHSKKLMDCLLGQKDEICRGCDFCPPGVSERVARVVN